MGRQPRKDPNERLLHRFYEPLVLLSILEPTQGRPEVFEDSAGETDRAKLWQKALDNLSWICDYRHGGETVSSIGAQRTYSGPVFWLAANRKPTKDVIQHLAWILMIIESSFHSSRSDRKKLQEEISTRCIKFSRDKVKNYTRRLCTSIEKCRHELGEDAGESGTSLSRSMCRARDTRLTVSQVLLF